MSNFNEYLIEHLKHNMQFCPFCHSYNVVYKKKLDPLMDLWRCKGCKKEFNLPNKYSLNELRRII